MPDQFTGGFAGDPHEAFAPATAGHRRRMLRLAGRLRRMLRLALRRHHGHRTGRTGGTGRTDQHRRHCHRSRLPADRRGDILLRLGRHTRGDLDRLLRRVRRFRRVLRMNHLSPAGPPTTGRPGLPGALAQISTDRMAATVDELAADRYAGRRVGAAGDAAGWLARQLRDLGAVLRVERFPVPGVRDVYRAPVLRWRAGTTRQLAHRREFVVHHASSDLPGIRTGPLAPANDRQLRGRWLLAADDDWPAGVRRAEAGHAAGVLVPRVASAEGWLPKLVQGAAGVAVPVIGVRADRHRELAELLGSGEVEVTASAPARTLEVTGTNLHAQVRSARGRPRVLLTAHYDGVGDDPDHRLPAAADNATGVAAVLEAARVLVGRTPEVDLAVSFLDGEEAGAAGSAHHAPSVAPDTLVVNVDGAGRLGEAAAVEAGGPAHGLLAVLDRAGRQAGVPLAAGPVASDNRRYAAAGLPAVGIGLGVPGYHTPADTPDRVDRAALRAAASLLVTLVWLLSDATPAAGWAS